MYSEANYLGFLCFAGDYKITAPDFDIASP